MNMTNSCFVAKTGRLKTSYTKQEAFAKSKEIQASGGGYLRPYPCGCGSWHITSQRKFGK